MRKISTILIAIIVLFSQDLLAQPCTTHIVTDTLICDGTQATLVADVSGPDNQLMASNTAGNNHRGNMFDIVATNSVKILSFDVSPMGNTTIEIYYKTGSWNGYANSPGDWTMVGSAPVVYTGGFVPVAVPVNVVIPAGQTYAFYVTSNNTAVALNYSNGNNVGDVYSSDANISFLEGGGMEYPFTQGTGAVYQPRVWNGNIHYSLADLPTTYSWSTAETTDEVDPVVSGDTQFTVETTITGCATMNDTVLIHTSTPDVNAGSGQTVCAGDSVVLNATGNGVSYTWDNGVTNGAAFAPPASATYTVVALDTMGCTDTAAVLVNVNPLPSVNAGNDLSICAGDSVVLSTQGAASYSWNNGVTDGVAFAPVSTAAYVVEGTDNNGCINSDTVLVTVNPLPSVSAGSDMDVCAGEDIILTGTGTGVISYFWNNGVINGQAFAPSVSNDYIVVGMGIDGCTNFDTVSVSVHTITAALTTSGATLQAGPASASNYQWVDCNAQAIFIGANSSTYVPAVTGSYGVIVTDQYGCTDTSTCETIFLFGLEEQLLDAFTVYPNPTTGAITVASAGQAITSVEVYDIIGQRLYTQPASSILVTVDLSRFQGTQFIAKISNADGFQLVKVLKQ